MPRIQSKCFKLLLLSAAIACMPLSSTLAAGDTSAATSPISATELANQLSAAYGGMARIKEMLNRGSRSHGKLNNMSSISSASNTFECEFLSKGNKLRIEMEIFGQQKIEAYDGKIGWSQMGDWVNRIDEKTVERVNQEMKHGLNALEKLDDPTHKLEILPSKQVNGKSCDLLKLTAPNGKWTLFYVDPLSRMVLRCEFMGQDSEQGVEALKTVDYYDYRNVMGFPTPFRVVEHIAGRKTQEAIMDAITIDDSIGDKTFQMPEESRYSRLESGPVTIPFEYAGNEIIVTARINNGAEAKFIVDTGASQTVIDKTTAQALGPTTVKTFNVTAGAKAIPLSYTKLDKFQLGDLNLENVATLVTDLSSLSAAIGQRPAGLIGANVLRRFLVTIDFQDKKLILADPHNVSIPDNGVVVPTSPVFAATGLVVNGILDDKPMNFLVDTGAAFNNLPFSLAAKLNTGAVLSVGQINGLDGLKTNIGSLKLKSLKLGNFTFVNPVFALQPDKGTTSGLFTASQMGILGNPIWSKTRLSIDYRNDRLIIETPPDRQKVESYLAKLEDVDRGYQRNKNIDEAAASYEKLMNSAKSEGVKAAEAFAVGRLASLYADKYNLQKESRWIDLASKEYERAAKLATESRNKSVEGQILAQWAMLYLNAPRSNTDLQSAQNLLKKALARAPMEGSIYAALGTAMLKTSSSKISGARFIDQALMLDPSNWQALWSKCALLEAEKKVDDLKLLSMQIARYYPDFPQTRDLQAKIQKMGGTKAPATVKKPAPRSNRRR